MDTLTVVFLPPIHRCPARSFLAGDGAYPYKNLVNTPIRKLFHIPEKRPYAPPIGE